MLLLNQLEATGLVLPNAAKTRLALMVLSGILLIVVEDLLCTVTHQLCGNVSAGTPADFS